MRHLVLAPCTRRKRVQVKSILRASDLEPGPITHVAEVWVTRVRCADRVTAAEDLYAGRGIVEARRAASSIGAQLYFVSAGLGLIHSEQAVPAYSLTVGASDGDSIASKVVGRFSARMWWEALHHALGIQGGVLKRLLQSYDGAVILALPGTYLDLIAHELAALPSDSLARVRLIGAPQRKIGSDIADLWMPYDARFESAAGPNPGTKSDFAQRAARHFAESVVRVAPHADAKSHSAIVERCLHPLRPPTPPCRAVGTDAELIEVIRELLPQSGGRSGETLKLLRHQAGRACEQGRFRRLFAAANQGVSAQ